MSAARLGSTHYQGQLKPLNLRQQNRKVEVVVVYIQRAELALVGLVNRNRPNAKSPVQVFLNEFHGQRFTDNFVLCLLLAVFLAT